MIRCPFPYCKRDVEEGHFACKTHWFRMPNAAKKKAMVLVRCADAGTLNTREYHAAVQKLVGSLFHLFDCETVPDHNYQRPEF